MCTNKHDQSGLTLIELVMFIVIVSVALTGVVMVLNTAVRGSADPVVRKQALAIAESLLTEIEQQPFTYCDPQDFPYDNVADYGNFSMNPVIDITGANLMNGYSAKVAMTRAGNAAPFTAITDPAAVLRIAVTVTNGGTSVTLVGYRFRYAPNN